MNKANNDGDTPLHVAAQRFHLGALDAIHGNMSRTFIFVVPFCLAAFKLLSAGALVDVKNNAGLTPLDYCLHLVSQYKEHHTLISNKFTTAAQELEESRGQSSSLGRFFASAK